VEALETLFWVTITARSNAFKALEELVREARSDMSFLR
jgi:hypothetical protein